MSLKQHYQQICTARKDIPIFAQPFWLDVFAEKWNVILIDENLSIIKNISTTQTINVCAALPFCIKGNLITKRIYLPYFNFYQSILFFDVPDKNIQQKISEIIFENLPKVLKSYFKFLPQYSNIDLSKLNFKKSQYATYLISDYDIKKISKNHTRNITKAVQQQYQLVESNTIAESFKVIASTFTRKKMRLNFNENEFVQLHKLVKIRKCGAVINCIDATKNILSSAVIVYDNQTVYYLLSGYDSNFRNSGAMTFLLHQLIEQHTQAGKVFNFCGSAQQSIAHFFEGFGAQKAAISIWKKSML